MEIELYIDGVWRQGTSDEVRTVTNPADESTAHTLRCASPADLDEAVAAAERAAAGWRATAPQARGELLVEAARLLTERREEIARAVTVEQGKTLAESAGEVDRAAETLRWNAEEGTRLFATLVQPTARHLRQMSVPEPVGTVVGITAWNFPVVLPARKLAPALAAGCPVILKGAEETPASAVAVVSALHDAGVPRGVVNLVMGIPDQISEHLLRAPSVRKLTLTGSTRVGRVLADLASENLVECVLELGGHAPALIFHDADIEAAADALSAFKWRNAGQVCLAPSRFYVDERVFDEFVDAFLARTRAVKVGNGLDPEATMGPLNNPARVAAMERYVEDATSRGASVVHGGKRLGDRGYFWEPTVVTGVSPKAEVMCEEPFGPIAPIAEMSDMDDALRHANDTPFGLAAYVFTASTETAHRMASALEVGTVGINACTPFMPDTPVAGAKQSGYGYEGGRLGVEAFVHYKLVSQPAGAHLVY